VDGVVFGHTYLHGVSISPTQELIRSAKKLSDRYQKPVVFLMIAGKKYFFTLKETADSDFCRSGAGFEIAVPLS